MPYRDISTRKDGGRMRQLAIAVVAVVLLSQSAALIAVANQDTRLRDWANLSRYRDANKSVTRADAVFMGDSITDFWQQPRFGGFFAGRNYVDRGISAQTTPQML